MIWIIVEGKSHQATGVNMMLKDEFSELWIERPTGKTLKVFTGTSEEVMEYKKAIDYAVKEGHTTFEIN